MRPKHFVVLALIAACGGPKAPVAPPPVDVAQEQRLSTIRVETTPDTEVKKAYAEAITESALPDDLADGVDSTSQGSGFFLKANGKLYVVTNHHVVGGSRKAKVRFDEHTVIEDADVVYADDHFDVAVIAVPEGPSQTLAHVVSLTQRPAGAGEQVEASGWPGVGDELSYRLTAGTISDPNFLVPGESKSDRYVQHTAVIDPGNSGGPLFRKTTLEVLGINTLSFTDNHDLYVAVPSAIVQTVLDRAGAADKLAHDPALRRAALVSTCHDLVQEISNTGDPPKETVAILSDELAAPLGVVNWEARHVKRSHDDKPRVDADALKDLEDEVKGGDVIEHLRPYAMNELYEDVRKIGAPKPDGCEQGLVQKDLDDLTDRGFVRCRIDFAGGKAFRTLKWRLEQGHWRLMAFDAP